MNLYCVNSSHDSRAAEKILLSVFMGCENLLRVLNRKSTRIMDENVEEEQFGFRKGGIQKCHWATKDA